MELSYTYWAVAEGGFIGYLHQYPDHWTQGETREELEEMLLSLYDDIRRFDDIQSYSISYRKACTSSMKYDKALHIV